MSVYIKTFQAKNGESFLLTVCGEQDINILIDFGVPTAYRDEIKPVLMKMKKEGKKIDYLILTHPHSDHIGGAIPFFVENGSDEESKIIKVENILYNGFLPLCLKNYPERVCTDEEKLIYKGVCKQAQALLQGSEQDQQISMKEEVCLSKLLIEGKYNWNGKRESPYPILMQEEFTTIPILEDICIELLSPNRNKLERFNSEWEKYLKKIKRKLNYITNEQVQEAYEAVMLILEKETYEALNQKISNEIILTIDEIKRLSNSKSISDDSSGNGTSLAFILKVKDRKMLFLGDAHPDVYETVLSKIYENEDKVRFDLIKLAHHGSIHNVPDNFFEKYTSSKFLLSTAGAYGHPNIETLSQIITTKGNKEVYYTNFVENIKAFENEALKEEFKYKLIDATSEIIKLSEGAEGLGTED